MIIDGIQLYPVAGFEGLYSVSRCGRVYSHARYGAMSKWLRMTLDKNGYARVAFTRNNIAKTHKVHRVVALTFLPNPNNLPCVNHINGIRNDNRVENLEWCTIKQNVRHAWATGRAKALKGELSATSKISDLRRIELVQDYALTSMTQNQIALKYGISQANVSLIIRGYLQHHFESGQAIDASTLK